MNIPHYPPFPRNPLFWLPWIVGYLLATALGAILYLASLGFGYFCVNTASHVARALMERPAAGTYTLSAIEMLGIAFA